MELLAEFCVTGSLAVAYQDTVSSLSGHSDPMEV